MKLEPILSLALNLHASKGVYALLLGSGVSRSAKIPTGWEVILDFVRKIAAMNGESCDPDPADWFRKKFSAEPDYSKLLDELAKTPQQRQQLLRGYFEPTPEEKSQGFKAPTKAHLAIAQLVSSGHIKIILTTNFDRLMERAIEDLGIIPVVLNSADAISGALPLPHQSCVIVKLHGDYLDSRIKNTPTELEKYEPALDAMIDRVLADYGLIVAGWSGDWDIALRSAIERCPTRRFNFYFTHVTDLSDRAIALLKSRSGTAIRITDADSFLETLASKVAVLGDMEGNHPISVAIAVAEAKRYLSDPNGRIRLHDLLIAEADRASEAIIKFNATVLHQQPNYEQAVQTYFDATKIIRSLAAVTAHWGRELEHGQLLQKCLARLSRETTLGKSGTVLNDGWRLYGTVIVTYSALLGYTSAGNYAGAVALLTQTRLPARDGTELLLKQYQRHYYTLNQITKAIKEHERHFFPMSEKLFNMLKKEFDGFVADDASFDDKFDEAEFLITLILADLTAEYNSTHEAMRLLPGRWTWKYQEMGPTSPLFWNNKKGSARDLARSQPIYVELVAAKRFGADADNIAKILMAATEVCGRYH